MEAELKEICQFIKQVPPFDTLSGAKISELVKHTSIEYQRKGTQLSRSNEPAITPKLLYIIRKGALAYYGKDNELLSKYSEGDLCSVFLMPEHNAHISVLLEEDTLFYQINKHDLDQIIADSPEARAFFGLTASERLNQRINNKKEQSIVSSTLMNTQVSDFFHTPVATIAANETIQATAQKMSQLGFSCLVVTQPEFTADAHTIPSVAGIVTDKDIRKRCVAQGLDVQSSVSAIMSEDILTLDERDSAYDALITMTSRNIHHLPVTKEGQLTGMVTVTDLMNHEGQNAVNMAGLIRKSDSIEALVEISQLLPKLQIRMAKLGTSADHVGKSISAITMAFTVQLIKMAEDKLGPAPVPYAWLAAGSQARNEQLAHSDQDNALIIDNSMLPEHRRWFSSLANFVCNGLAACGFIYCPGDIMATNNKWQQTQTVWQQYFQHWVENPNPNALLNASVFFDLTTVHGDQSLLRKVREDMLQRTQKNSLFIAHLSRNALAMKPPLGLFRDFVLTENGNDEKSLDLKHNGIAPIVDLARIYALQEGIKAVNTLERLKAVAGTSSLTASSAHSLIDAYEFLAELRLQHQAKLLAQGQSPNNYMHPKEISRLEREHLKEAFKVIKTLQNSRQVSF